MENSNLFDLASSYFQKYTNLIFRQLFYGDTIPKEMLNAARENYAIYDAHKEKPILLFCDALDADHKPSAAEGILITNKNFYCRLRGPITGTRTINCIPLVNIKSFLLEQSFLYSKLIVNDKYIAQVDCLNIRLKIGRKIIEELVNIFIDELSNAGKPETNSSMKKYYNDSSIEPFSEIKRLKDLLDKHIIDEDEFNSRKRELLSII